MQGQLIRHDGKCSGRCLFVLPFPRLRVWQCLQVCLEIVGAKSELSVVIGLRVLIALAKPCPYLSRLHSSSLLSFDHARAGK